MSLTLSRFTGRTICLDTMLPYALLRGVDPAAEGFFARIEKGTLFAYTSALTFDELAYRFLLALIKDRYGGSPLDRLRAYEERLITEFAPIVSPELHRLRNFPHLTVVDVTAFDVDLMNQAMTQYAIRPRDALHFAAMQRITCFDLASHDQHFDRIPQVRRYTL